MAEPIIRQRTSDDWFSHETLSHNGMNLPRFSLCAFVYAALPESGIEHFCRTKAYCNIASVLYCIVLFYLGIPNRP